MKKIREIVRCATNNTGTPLKAITPDNLQWRTEESEEIIKEDPTQESWTSIPDLIYQVVPLRVVVVGEKYALANVAEWDGSYKPPALLPQRWDTWEEAAHDLHIVMEEMDLI